MASVLDGDTLVLESGERLRLRGIDAPELRHGNDPGQYYGVESKSFDEAGRRKDCSWTGANGEIVTAVCWARLDGQWAELTLLYG